MSLLAQLFKAIEHSVTGKRSWTPNEIRELIERKELTQALKAVESLSPHTHKHDAMQHCLRGEILFHQRLDDEAQTEFQAALKIFPGMPEGHYGLSLILAEQGNFDTAARHALFAVNLQPDSRHLAQLGYCHLELQNYQSAEAPLRRATSLSDKNPHTWNNLGIVLMAKGDMPGARQCFMKALQQNPSMAVAHQHLAELDAIEHSNPPRPALSIETSDYLLDNQPNGDDSLNQVILLEQSGDLPGAIEACEALLLQGNEANVPLKLSQLYTNSGDLESAIAMLEAYLIHNPGCASVSGALGLLQLKASNWKLAESQLQMTLEHDPDQTEYLLGLAKSLTKQERFEEAAPLFAKALSLKPENREIKRYWASSLTNQCRYEEAIQTMEELKADGLQLGDVSTVLGYLGRTEEALAKINAQIAHQPNHPDLRFQRAFLNLSLEKYAEGWDDYKFRGLSNSRNYRILPFPLWNGEPLDRKKIIILAEQGLGDQVMFASCIPDLLAYTPETLIIEANVRAAKTLERSFPSATVIASSQKSNMAWATDFSNIDYFVPLADLPCRFRRNKWSFPEHSGYLVADPARVVHWRTTLEQCGPGPYYGVSWKGGTEITRKVIRSFSPETFFPLSKAVAATWVCLQYGEVQNEVSGMKALGMPLEYWKKAISDLDEFAALISALDGVISVCNTTVHYAGALGKPVWVLAPRIPEWRYGLHNTKLPWYPSSHIIRQTRDNDWTGPINAVCEEVAAFSARKCPPF